MNYVHIFEVVKSLICINKVVHNTKEGKRIIRSCTIFMKDLILKMFIFVLDNYFSYNYVFNICTYVVKFYYKVYENIVCFSYKLANLM